MIWDFLHILGMRLLVWSGVSLAWERGCGLIPLCSGRGGYSSVALGAIDAVIAEVYWLVLCVTFAVLLIWRRRIGRLSRLGRFSKLMPGWICFIWL